jgi:hypothetical protein
MPDRRRNARTGRLEAFFVTMRGCSSADLPGRQGAGLGQRLPGIAQPHFGPSENQHLTLVFGVQGRHELPTLFGEGVPYLLELGERFYAGLRAQFVHGRKIKGPGATRPRGSWKGRSSAGDAIGTPPLPTCLAGGSKHLADLGTDCLAGTPRPGPASAFEDQGHTFPRRTLSWSHFSGTNTEQ